MTKKIIGFLPLVAALSGVGCNQGDIESPPAGSENVIHELNVNGRTRIVFVDEGDGNVGVAEISQMGEVPIVTTMIRAEGATPLEIFMATADDGEEAPELLVENHHSIAARQGREDAEPRTRVALKSKLGSLMTTMSAFIRSGTTPCDEDGWEGVSGAWGDPIDSWDNIFANSTSEWNGTTSYPKAKTITQGATWNGGSGSYHTHGACISDDTGADNKITLSVKLNGSNVVTWSTDLDELVGNNEWATFNDYFGFPSSSKSEVTNVGNSAASFRHSAAAWVPFPG